MPQSIGIAYQPPNRIESKNLLMLCRCTAAPCDAQSLVWKTNDGKQTMENKRVIHYSL
jgi:hypothetical protein